MTKEVEDEKVKDWPHQERALNLAQSAVGHGYKRPLITAPTGSGKSRMQREIIRRALNKGNTVLLMLHRRMLMEQVCRQFKEQGIDYGLIAAGQPRKSFAPIQICMLQTVGSRRKNESFDMPHADIVIWDEQHAQKAGQALEINQHYLEQGAIQIGYTATPVDCAATNDVLCVAGNYSDMLECNAHLPIKCFGPDRPDLSMIKPMSAGEYSENQCRKVIKVHTVFGRVYEHWQKLNPEQYPAINFASGTKEARFWVEEFAKRGVPTASIDSNGITMARFLKVDGVKKLVIKEYDNERSARKALFTEHEFGGVKIIHNRFMLRESWDCPIAYHCIVTTPMRSLCTYLQSVGRIMRSNPAYDHKLLQDHGGVIETPGLGFPNRDRDWLLGDTEASIRKREKKRLQKTPGEEAEPICCPKCSGFRTHGRSCPHCGHRHKQSARIVRQLDGELQVKRGRVEKYKKPPTCEKIWTSTLFGCARTGKRVSAAIWLAKKRCEEKGIVWNPHGFRGYLAIPPDTQQSVRRVYPWTCKNL